MAHELSFNLNGSAEMAYVGEKPWHGFGQEVNPNASLDEWMTAAHMDWSINRAPVQFSNADTGLIGTYPESHVLYRSDNGLPLSTVSDRYKVVQPKAMIEFFRSLVEREGFEIETIGALKEGRRIWALAKTNIENDVIGGDRLKAYVLLITSCDGSLATTAKFTSVRVVCWNTQAIALSEGGKEVKVRHNTIFDPDTVKGEMGLIGAHSFDTFLSKMRGLTKVKISQSDAISIVSGLLPKPVGEKTIIESKGFVKVMQLFNGAAKGSDLAGVSGTAWGLLNAMTEYVDHHARAHNAENRLQNQWFGKGALLKDATEQLLCEMIV